MNINAYALKRIVDSSVSKSGDDYIAKIPSMMSAQEQHLLFLLSRDYYSYEGKIIDAGHFLGSSTYSICAGLARQAGKQARQVFSYDLGIWYKGWTELLKKDGWLKFFELFPECYELGDLESFIPVYKRAIAEYIDLVNIRSGDLVQILETEGFNEKIEVLFLDLCKMPKINHATQKFFFGNLIPGKSVLIQQDFLCDSLPWLYINLGYFSDFFQFIGFVGSSAVYLFTREIPGNMLNTDCYYDLNLEEKEKCYDASLALVSNDYNYKLCRLAKLKMYHDFGETEKYSDLLREYENYPELQAALNSVIDRIGLGQYY